jgi:hypothetical protein
VSEPVSSRDAPTCANNFDVSPDDLKVEITCAMCDRAIPIGYAIASAGASAGAWAYRLSPSMQRGFLMESLALLAVQSTLGSLSTGPNRTRFQDIGVRFKVKDVNCEVDVLSLVDRGRILRFTLRWLLRKSRAGETRWKRLT